MAACLAAKFEDPGLRARLLATGDRELVDGHRGSPDLIWGYHVPSQAGQNRLGILLMELRARLRAEQGGAPPGVAQGARGTRAALYKLDWPMKCLHDGLPSAYAGRIAQLAGDGGLLGGLVVLPGRMICIALRGDEAGIGMWERKMRTEDVDVNSRGRPCRERMLVELAREVETSVTAASGFERCEVSEWAALCDRLAAQLGVPAPRVEAALGPEWPPLPRSVRYADGRSAVVLDGQRFPLCLNDGGAVAVPDAGLGPPAAQRPRGGGAEVPLATERGRPSIFGGRFARSLEGLLDAAECARLVELTEAAGYGLAGSRGFNPQARFALRCLVDAPQVAAAVTARLSQLLPAEYPPGSGRLLVGVNERLRFLKYLPGMHHSGDHTDCAHEDARGRSFLTVQLYLNSSFVGGRTTFVSDRLVPVEPSTGCAVVFDHELYHRGGIVTEGTKYAVRMDVLYGPPGGGSAPCAGALAPGGPRPAARAPGAAVPAKDDSVPERQKTSRWVRRA
ncbi:unnamed protein product [Prorocentrum cordatum]|uniref:Fe2OG dioxygenase domain-containing protein n=1 Tax=Prorocentrum cordatum TaxID=2364126 RepID=A0ABN9PBM0_9DINO|nr:unnamed protein product [Polarella glacialis]